ncbi:MAG: EAL domain-containing protein [Gammaproteobacteria bacterium]|nr:EAL domain-containing protein [Gammaproteobacteria bacterium]MDH4311123.1 EAL domain-containing protein [Gammaproteobacteria bacterium]MDH5272296.1 EAL domain-containing protein [Gammaproteobacteria bacterium]
MSSQPPPIETDEQETVDFLATQFVFGNGEHPTVGLDVLVTKVAVDFVGLTSEAGDNCVKRNLDALREATGVDAICIALLDGERKVIERVAAATGLVTPFDPQVMKGDAAERLPVLNGKLEHLRIAEMRDTLHPRREHAVDAARLAEFNVRSALVCGLSLNGRVNGFIALFSSQPRNDGWDANLHLMLKLVGASFATGLERLRVLRYLARLEERNALSLPAANDGMWDFDVENNTVYYSPRWRKMLGYDEHDANVTPDWRRLVHPDDLARVQAMIRDHIAGRTPMFESVHRMRHVKGDWRWVVSRAQARVDGSGRLRRLVCVEFDITERKLYEDALFKEKESAQITLQSIGDGVITTDGHMIVEYLNPTAEELTGWKFEEAQGKGIDEIFRGFHEETCEPLENPLSVAIRRARAIKSVRPTLLIKRDGNEMYIESTASPIRDGSGAVCGGVLVFHDVSESRELNRKLSYHASHDILTGLVNRREFEARLERSLRSAKARETQYALCHLDVDQFKIINDTCGHSAGDALLGQVGALLKTKIRWRDTLARLGGDEFGVLLESCSLDDALVMAEQLRETMRNYKFVWEDRTFRLGCSIGVVPITGDSEDVATVLSSADSACQAAKEGGRNRVFSFQDNDIDLMRRRREMQWAARINNALEESRFELFRMTIQPLQKHEPGAHYELLLRMRDETGKIVSPDNFINAAERYGITPQIDRWVVEHALRWLVSEADERERLALCSINLSGQSLGDAEFLPFVQKLLKNSGIDGTKICFEITETAAIASFSQANRFIAALKEEQGCKFALDDFGTGLSSFGYLKHFPVDYLKIDGSFVKEILRDPIDREMVRSINEIGHLTGKQTIAEFAENEEIINMLRSLGVDYAQGYGISVPTRILKIAVNS